MKHFAFFFALLTLSACEAPVDDGSITYTRDVLPILQESCVSCHTEGEIGPFPLTNFAEVYQSRELIARSIEAETMPPWPPDNDCNEYLHDRSLTDDEKATLIDWAQGDALEGQAKDAPALPPDDEPFVFDVTLRVADPYTPVLRPDDYRCHIIPWPGDTEEFIVGYQVKPDQAQIVHHVIAFAVPEAMADTFYDFDAADDGAGYTCFGSPFPADQGGGGASLTGTRWLGSWAPGGAGRSFPAGTGIKIEPGSLVIVQMHYNTTEVSPAADQTSIAFKVADTVDKPALILPYTNPGWVLGYSPMTLPAGEASVKYAMSWDIIENDFLSYFGDNSIDDDNGLMIHMSGLHMHQLGKAATLSIARSDGTDDCLLEIPDWEFEWQGGYFFKDPVLLYEGDKLALSCEWDNSAENQPVIDGQVQEPQDVSWGDGTSDEMCLGILYVTEP
jgi:hypothetical protein